MKKLKIRSLSLYQGRDKICDYPYTYLNYVRLKHMVRHNKYKKLKVILNSNIIYE